MKMPIGNNPSSSGFNVPKTSEGDMRKIQTSSPERQQEPSKGSPGQPIVQPKKEDKKTMKIIDWIVKGSIYLTVFFLPIFFLSNIPSVLGLSKQAFLSIVVGIGFLAWVGKMAWRNEIRFRSNFILVPVVVLLLIFGLSTISSVYTEQSLWGYFGGEAEAFITLLFLIAFFILVFNTIQGKKDAVKLILTFLASGILVSINGLLIISGVNKLQIPITVGSVYLFSAYAGALLLMTLGLFLSGVSKGLKVFLVILSFFFAFIVMAINFKIVLFGLIACLVILLGITIVRGKTEQSQAKILPMIFLVLFFLTVLRGTPIIRLDLPIEVTLNQKTSFSIAFQSFKKNPLLGSGPTSYAHVYKLYRPDNLGDFWSVNFNGANSYFLTIMSTTGILGALSFLFLVAIGVIYLFRNMIKAVSTDKKEHSDTDYIAIGAGIMWFFLTIILFFYIANITILMLWWFSFALFLSFSFFDPKMKSKEFVTTSATPKSSLLLSFVFVLVIIGFVAAIYLQSQKFVAAINFSKALAMDAEGEEIQKVTDQINRTIQIDPNRDIYYRNMATALFALANQRVAEKGQDLSADDSAYVSNMISGSLGAVDRARSLDSNNSDNHVAVAQVYEGVLLSMEGADKQSIESYEEALKYDPSNPALYQRLANIYVTLADVEIAKAQAQAQGELTEIPEKAQEYLAKARENVEKALSIKPDFATGHLMLVGIYEREGNLEKAIEKEIENKSRFANDPAGPLRLGLLYYKDEQFENAEVEFRAALVLDEDYANAMYFLGLTLDKQGDKQGALVQFRRVGELNPDNEEVKKIIENLENGRDALDGLQRSQNEAPVQEGQGGQPARGEQPNINPDVEQQEIPEEATPKPEDVNNEEEPEEPAPEEPAPEEPQP